MLLQQTTIFTASIAIANPRAAIYTRRHANFMSDLQTILIRCRTAVQQCLLICVSANPIHALCGAKITRRHIVPASTLPADRVQPRTPKLSRQIIVWLEITRAMNAPQTNDGDIVTREDRTADETSLHSL